MDARRGERILAFLQDQGLVGRRDVDRPRPVALHRVLAVHSAAYLERLQRPETLTEILGITVTEAELEAVLDLQRLMVGGTIQATRIALGRERIGVNLGGGFHHATPERGMGFCVFNDIAVSIARLRAKGFDRPVLVVDLDMHDGNGTRAAFATDPSVYTLSIHHTAWDDTPAVADTSIALGPGVTDDVLLDTLRRELPPVVRAHRPTLVLYVAGTDAAADDRLGDWELSHDGMLARDRFVLETVRGAGGPAVAILLGGGYGDEAWRYSARFFAWLLSGTVIEPPSQMARVLERIRDLADAIQHPEFSTPRVGDIAGAGGGWDLSEAELWGAVATGASHDRVLDHYSKHGIELMLERVEFLDHIRVLGYANPHLDIVRASGGVPTIRLYADPERSALLMELKMGRTRRVVPDSEVIFVEWLLLQNPRASFSADHPRLPGQEHPGLGMLREIFGWLIAMCRALGLDGIAFVPSHYYMAVLGKRYLRFVDPEKQASFEALHRVLGDRPLARASAALEAGQVRDAATGQSVSWEPAVMVVPVSAALRERVGGRDYTERVSRAARRIDFRLDPVAAT